MTLVKVYSIETGHVETVKSIDFPDARWEKTMATAMVDYLTTQDHGTDTVYYISQES